MLNTYPDKLGMRHLKNRHCPAQLLATAKIAKACVGDMLPAVSVPDSPLTRRGDFRPQSFISIELRIKHGEIFRKFE